MNVKFTQSICDAGLRPPGFLIPGVFHRFPGRDKDDKNKAGWAILFDNRQSGVFGDFSSDFKQCWHEEDVKTFTHEKRTEFYKQCEEAKKKAKAERAKEHQASVETAKQILDAAKSDPKTHPYAIKKAVDLGPLVKRGAWPQRSWTDALIVPVLALDGTLATVQAINTHGKKDFLHGGKKAGGFYPLSDIKGAAKIFVGEGLATMAAVHAATSLPSVVAFDSGNLMAVCQAIQKLEPTAEIIVCADNDIKPDGSNPGLQAATNAAEAIGGHLAVPEIDGRKVDFWDVWHERGADAVKAQLFPKQSESKARRRMFVPLAELIAKPMQTDWLIRDYIETDSTVLLFGESGAGKSFLAVDLALCIATGTDWNGHAVGQGAVFYLAGEGHAGFAKRFIAWAAHTGTDISTAPFFLSTSAIGLPDDATLNRFLHEIEVSGTVPALIVIDTLARSLIGDENRSDDVGGFVRAIDQIRMRYGCSILIVHHTGHNNNNRARGSSALKAAMDTELGLTNKANAKCLEVTKQKNHEPVSPKLFKLQQVPTPWCDEDGNTIFSAVMVLDGTVKPIRSKKPRLSLRDDAILTALRRALVSHGTAPSADIKARFGGFDGYVNAHRMVVDIERWRDEAYPVIDAEGKDPAHAKKTAFQRARAKLQNAGYVQTMADFWWLLDDEPINRHNTAHTGTDVPTCAGVSGDEAARHGTHSYRSVPPVPSIDTQESENGDDL